METKHKVNHLSSIKNTYFRKRVLLFSLPHRTVFIIPPIPHISEYSSNYLAYIREPLRKKICAKGAPADSDIYFLLLTPCKGNKARDKSSSYTFQKQAHIWVTNSKQCRIPLSSITYADFQVSHIDHLFPPAYVSHSLFK